MAMTNEQKLAKVKIKLNISDTSMDIKLTDYLDSAKREILAWQYINYASVPETVTDVPEKYEMVQIEAVVVGFNIEGGENEASHNENGISRVFVYSQMVDYIRAHVFQIL